MDTQIFESRLMPDGHLYCPEEFIKKKNAQFKVIVILDDSDVEATENDIELSSIRDISHDFLSEEELNYYLNLEEV